MDKVKEEGIDRCGREIRRPKGEQKSWMGGNWRTKMGGFTREMGLVYCCLTLPNCSLTLATESVSKAIFDAEFIWWLLPINQKMLPIVTT